MAQAPLPAPRAKHLFKKAVRPVKAGPIPASPVITNEQPKLAPKATPTVTVSPRTAPKEVVGVPPEINAAAEQVLTSLLTTFISFAEVIKALRILRETLEAGIYTKNAPVDPSVRTTDVFYYTWIKTLDFSSISKNNYQTINRIITERVAALPKLVVYLPIVSTRDDLLRVRTKAKENIAGAFLLDVRFDKDLIAGCALVWHGRYQDYSLRAKLAQRRDSISKILLAYGKNQ